VKPDPSGIGNDRGVVQRIEDDVAVLAVGPSRTPMRVPLDELPAGVTPGTWLILDLQVQPPIVLQVDDAMTRERR
jgi:hypothetical protein